jgi:hypothetical protein
MKHPTEETNDKTPESDDVVEGKAYDDLIEDLYTDLPGDTSREDA